LRGDDDAQKDQQIDELMEVFARYAGVATR
jgi:hypothetical protein